MKEKHLKQKKTIHEKSLEQDIRYRGPLSYRTLRILGWICIAIAQVLVVYQLSDRLNPGYFVISYGIMSVLATLAGMTIPLFILANFSQILNSADGYKKQLLTNGLAAAGIAVFLIFFYLRYGVGVAAVLLGNRSDAIRLLDQLIASVSKSGFLAFNFFVDFFLCTLFLFFLNYRPKRFFQGKALLGFRLLVAIPVLYEIVSLVLKYLAAKQVLVLPAIIYPLLTAKPPMMFLVFVVLAVIIKNRERVFCRHGGTHQEYQAFLKTNRNSLHFSIFTAIVFAAAGIIDFIVFSILLGMQVEGTANTIEIIRAMGFGNGTPVLLLLAPFVLLFSYTRRYKNIWPDVVIPFAGVVLVILVYLEGALQGFSAFLG
ncbi:MAG: hypothetical protein IKE94_06120 [Aeriscardovia sp.]|nr:hypothetical protein [Aeriscardovia sp.]